MATNVTNVYGARYEGAARGERFVASQPATASGVTGGTSFASATPLVGLGHTEGSKNILLDFVTFSQNGTVAGDTVSFLGFMSDSDRIAGDGASGGTAITPVCLNADVLGTSSVSFYEKRTIDGVSGTLYPVFSRTAPAILGTTTIISFDEGLFIPKTGCFLVYAFAGTTAPTLRYDITWREY